MEMVFGLNMKKIAFSPLPHMLEKQFFNNFLERVQLKMSAIVHLLKKETFSLSCSSLAIPGDMNNYFDRR